VDRTRRHRCTEAASSGDVDVLDALLDAGADIEAPGAVIGGGTPLADARAFKQWMVALRLIERGARKMRSANSRHMSFMFIPPPTACA